MFPIFLGLHKLLGKPIPVGSNNLSWTLLKFIQSDSQKHDSSDIEALTEIYSKLSIALDVMHECFEPVEEPHTKRDLLKDVIFSKESELNRLNFRGFYTVLLQKDDEFITVATVR
ncbi:increased DNA methylation 1-like [Hevea brasiliensis]|uniref:increased DNA methylation 1-like n=1 Tax=Hevea brasiliensis TaxID=3981 RepID=UPI0025EC335A|nr:increased DNA methylation 1-like [Hevea brasiliensis]